MSFPLLESSDRVLLEESSRLELEDATGAAQIIAPPASATASAPTPTFIQTFSTTVPPASATAAFPSPSLAGRIQASVASAVASFPSPVTHGGTPGVDPPTTLTFSYATEIVLVLLRELVLQERITALEMERVTEVELFRHVTELTVPRVTALTLSSRNTALELSMETTLELHDRELELVLDG